MKNKTNTTIFAIDMLKGTALPARIKPLGIMLSVATCIVPIMLTIALIGLYNHNKIVTSISKKEISQLESKIEKISDAVNYKKSLDSEKQYFISCISEVNSSIEKFTQWSPILNDIAESMPGSVVFTDLEIDFEKMRKDVPKKDNPKKTVEKEYIVTIMRFVVSDVLNPESDKAIQDFQNLE